VEDRDRPGEPDELPPCELVVPRWRQWLRTVVAVVATLILLALAISDPDAPTLAATAFTATVSVYLLRDVRHPSRLVLDRDGLLVESAGSDGSPLPWTRIVGFQLERVARRRRRRPIEMIVVEFRRDADGPERGVLSRLRQRIPGALVLKDPYPLSMPELLELLERYHARYGSAAARGHPERPPLDETDRAGDARR
jgi:hypothetical protein